MVLFNVKEARIRVFSILLLFTLVVVNPYSGIRYGEVDVYNYPPRYLEDVIHYTEPEIDYSEESDSSMEEVEENDEVFTPYSLDWLEILKRK
jgi:hypothetical protein